MENTEEDEWEYEYDDFETEDFYIPIDLANVPEAQGPVNALPKPGHPALLKSKLRAQNPALPNDSDDTITSVAEDSTPIGNFQLTGLHTSNPLILYNGQLLSCQWMSTIGTDLLFTKPQSSTSETEKPLRNLPSVDLIATSSAKLIARVGRLRPKDDVLDAMREEQQIADPVDVSEPAQDTTTEINQPTATVAPESRETRPASSSFLARLNAAKAKRGEMSQLVTSKTSDGTQLVTQNVETQPLGTREDEGEDIVMGGT